MGQNAAGGKGPCSGHVGGARTREGMSGETGTNSPGGRESTVQARQLQRRLWVAAKRGLDRFGSACWSGLEADLLLAAGPRVSRPRLVQCGDVSDRWEAVCGKSARTV